MKLTVLKTLSEAIEKTMQEKNLSPKELAQKSKIGYSSLIPILNGSRDFGITKLIAIANALECSTDKLLGSLLAAPHGDETQLITSPEKPQYLAVFISLISVTYCMVYEVSTKKQKITFLPYDFGCGQNPDEFIDHIASPLREILTKNFQVNTHNKNIAVFVSVQQYEGTNNREKIQKSGDNLFAKFIIESDVITNYRALFGNKNGICVTINDGSVIIYSTNHGKNFVKIQGYGFPIADTAGNEWLGCEAIRHVINVKEQVEANTSLSDKILALYHDNLDAIAESAISKPVDTFKKVSLVVKELILVEPAAHNIVKKSADLLLQRIKLIDQTTKTKLSIALAGDLADIYKEFFPKDRLADPQDKLSTVLLNYGLETLKKVITLENDEK